MVPVISSLLPSSLCHSQLRQTLRFTTVLLQTYLRPDIQLFGPLRARRTTIVALATLGITPVHYKRPPSGLHRLHWRGIENSLESASNTSRGKNGPDILTGALLATQNGRNIAVAPLAQTIGPTADALKGEIDGGDQQDDRRVGRGGSKNGERRETEQQSHLRYRRPNATLPSKIQQYCPVPEN
ncbi:hypothetical protein CERSUDRAFT_76716 [Gelatoporia subvermispora B]|uniref:Uncharacterized protein n=1 Tax=Ceriporiopsis subvermispora (strain B) TaxID=914234 RepID=M2R5T2_CERS8|nr:hypothetical protein CERSUDRAFT_76716 [Gelatoporia subvermispora B]